MDGKCHKKFPKSELAGGKISGVGGKGGICSRQYQV